MPHMHIEGTSTAFQAPIPVKYFYAALGVLVATLGVTTWKVFNYRSTLTAIRDNEHWERQLEKAGAYRNGQILFFGDSEIYYWPMAESFGRLPIRNRGVAGELAADEEDRFSRELSQTRPQLTVLLTGTNDMSHGKSLEETVQHVDAMLSKVEGMAIVCSLLPSGGDFATDRPPTELRRWNRALEALARAHGDQFVDLYSPLMDSAGRFRSDLTVDGLHPNSDGYARMTTAILPALTIPQAKMEK